MRDTYYITTPIFYPNGNPHIGHAYSAIASDVLARFQRLNGKNVLFLSGTDEHGLKMQQTAATLGITPQQLADRNSAVFQKMLAVLNCSNDDFIRTTEERHSQTCQEIWKRMEENGDIYLGRYKGWYSVRQEAYYEEKDTEIGPDNIRREKELGSPVEWNEEESYFFKLSRYEKALLEYYEKHPDFIAPFERRNEIISFIKSGLKDISISRTNFNWGVAVPDNPKHVMYVWVDALTNYLSAIDFFNKSSKKRDFWPANTHIIGKDIIRFHAVYWPAFLMSAGVELPKNIFAHGFLLNRGVKMSKSVGNVVDPFEMVDHYGLDQVRYFLLREVPFGHDGSYNHESLVSRINADLANDLGNLAQRSLSMIAKNCDAKVPRPAAFLVQDKQLLEQSLQVLETVHQAMSSHSMHLALSAIFLLVADANRYFANEQPWNLRKNDQERFFTVLYITIEILRRIGIMLLPFIPQSATKLLDSLAVAEDDRLLYHISHTKIQEGADLPPPEPIFPRYVLKKEDSHHAH
ncbi:methionine--tRNA ligase [Bartonella krasnovii]|uniref:Methionine--tRNA ligase n=1 Tax=Bartonella krasnovii TaxID=2267275 RepID=A0A5B9D0V0_9HYPH|nr:methionine--tRNA ligase [Bartonella krasnovii]QEE12213.1 methionine--tRNA ligase [Bartonella krasnovii]UNF29852.1 methionine--tRNA ligase [Bartonella krasnovii]UNF36213.1 methionine--tRNA ligase [Bartonella krasnovii]UNF37916.1 methionine--tRNA ligase [Bartonella krasnovii]UNF39584.1 methionine--tRNA ligase [Bartonella krasnovii]